MDNGASSYRRFLDGDDKGIAEIVRDYKDGLILYLNGYVNNIFVAEETRTISNNIFTISLMRRTMPFPNELYVVLVGKNGQPVSDMKKVKIAQEQFKVIGVQLQLNAGTANGEYYLITASQASITDSVLSTDICLVDIVFAMDMDFDF